MASSDPLQRTPLHARHREAGARLVDFAGYEMPIQYRGVLDEHHTVRRGAGIFDVSHMGEIWVEGAGALELLQRLTPNDVGRLKVGQAHYNALLNERGTFLDDLLIYRIDAEKYLVVVNAANRQRDLEWILEHSSSSDATVSDRSDDTALVALQGPDALSILEPLVDFDLDALRYYRIASGGVAGREALVARTGYTGEDGFEIYVANHDVVEVWDRLAEGGALPCGLGARDTLRLEAGMMLCGQDIGEDVTPIEAGLGWMVRLDKGDFIGREVLERQKLGTVERCIQGFVVEDRGIARSGHDVVVDGERIGRVTSGSWSPTLERAIGLTLIECPPLETDARLEILVRKRGLSARVAGLPFYRRAKRSTPPAG